MFKDMVLIDTAGSNSVLTTPLLTANIIIEPLPKIFYFFIIINNLLCVIIEFIANILKRVFSKNELAIRYIEGSFVGQYHIFRKK